MHVVKHWEKERVLPPLPFCHRLQQHRLQSKRRCPTTTTRAKIRNKRQTTSKGPTAAAEDEPQAKSGPQGKDKPGAEPNAKPGAKPKTTPKQAKPRREEEPNTEDEEEVRAAEEELNKSRASKGMDQGQSARGVHAILVVPEI